MSPVISLKERKRKVDELITTLLQFPPGLFINYAAAWAIEKAIRNPQSHTAILYGNPGSLLTNDFIQTGMSPLLSLGENRRGRIAHFYSQATYHDFVEVLQDDSIANLILIGHGTSRTWSTWDHSVTLDDLSSIPFNRKSGEVIKLTCGDAPRDGFALEIAQDPSKTWYFDSKIDWLPLQQYARHRVYSKK